MPKSKEPDITVITDGEDIHYNLVNGNVIELFTQEKIIIYSPYSSVKYFQSAPQQSTLVFSRFVIDTGITVDLEQSIALLIASPTLIGRDLLMMNTYLQGQTKVEVSVFNICSYNVELEQNLHIASLIIL